MNIQLPRGEEEEEEEEEDGEGKRKVEGKVGEGKRQGKEDQ